MAWYLANLIPVGQIDNALPGGGGPGGQPDNSLPGGRPPGIWGGGNRPDQGLPSGGRPGGRPDNSLPGSGGRPDNSLPSGGWVDNTLPGGGSAGTLPTGYTQEQVGEPPEEVDDGVGEWVLISLDGQPIWAWTQPVEGGPEVDPGPGTPPPGKPKPPSGGTKPVPPDEGHVDNTLPTPPTPQPKSRR